MIESIQISNNFSHLLILRLSIILLFMLTTSCSEKVQGPNDVDKVLKIKNLNQLGTVEYKLTKIIASTDELSWLKSSPRKVLFSCEASVKAGIDFSNIGPNDIKITGNYLTLTLPKAKIIYLKMDHQNIKQVYTEIGIFRSSFSNSEKQEILAMGEESIRKAIPKLNILGSAEVNASRFIATYLKRCGFKDVFIKFK